VCNGSDGVVLDETSVMLVSDGGPRRVVVAVGQEASELIGRAPAEVDAIRPLQDGVVTDLEIARLFLAQISPKLGAPLELPAAPVVIQLGPMQLKADGIYTWRVTIDGDTRSEWSASFLTIKGN
jgi:actin-like ATPase involved in cell morphogenesis